MTFEFGDATVSNDSQFFLIAGPCVIESEEHMMRMAGELKEITDRHGIDLIFKSSFDKANRSSIDSYRGPGLERGLEILQNVKDEYKLPVLTDFHTPDQAARVADVVDVLQASPAFSRRCTTIPRAPSVTPRPSSRSRTSNRISNSGLRSTPP